MTVPISLLHVPSIIFSSIRNMCRPGKPFAHPRPVKSRNTDAWLYGLYSYACVPLPALKPIYKIKYCACVIVGASATATAMASVNCGYVRINKCENIALVCKDNLCFVYVCTADKHKQCVPLSPPSAAYAGLAEAMLFSSFPCLLVYKFRSQCMWP